MPGGRADAIIVRGIRVEGRHGAIDGERDEPQPFVVDVEIRGDLSNAATLDTIDATIDYGEVVEVVRTAVANESHQLIEALAGSIASHITSLGAAHVTVRVSKPQAAETLRVDEIAVVIER
jgi:7,8-dihydroneopterin aldolase/epimerase/oxygenase